MRIRQLIRTVGVLLVLAGCGGGSGGGGDTGGGGGGITPGGSSGDLLPAPPALGAELASDASTLRPLRDGAVWTYRGSLQTSPTSAPVRYATTTRHVSSGAGAVTESVSNGGNEGPDSTTVALQAGRIGWTDRIGPFGTSAAETVEFVELRSPVRAGDQYTIHNRRYADGAGDVDGDARADALDLVVYGRVVGVESVSFENLPPVSAVRVDLVSRARVVPSRTGVPGAVQESVVSTWYARGIGIVRQRLSAPNDAGTGTETVDETLTAFDGVTSGFGASEPLLQTIVPLDSPDLAGTRLPEPREFHSAVGAGNGAYLLWAAPSPGAPSAVLRLSERGAVQWARSIPGSAGTGGRLLRSGNGLLLVGSVTGGTAITASRLDADGRLVGTFGEVRFDLSGDRVAAFVESAAVDGDGDGVWMVWRRQFFDAALNVFAKEVVVRAFSVDGSPLSGEYLIDADESDLPSLAGREGRALVSWKRKGTRDLMSATATYSGLGTPQLIASQGAQQNQSPPLPVHASGADALLWWWAIGGSPRSDALRGIAVEPTGSPIRAGSTPDSEIIAAWSPITNGQLLTPIGQGTRIVGVHWDVDRLWSTDEFTALVTTVSWLDPAPGRPLAGRPVNRIRVVAGDSGTIVGPPAFVLPLADRVLVLHAQRFVSVVHWLNNGT